MDAQKLMKAAYQARVKKAHIDAFASVASVYAEGSTEYQRAERILISEIESRGENVLNIKGK